MKYSTSLVLGALLSLSSATPVERRDADITSTVVMTTTVWVDVVETVNGFPPAQNKVAISSHLSQHAQGKAHNPTFTPVAATPTSTPTPAFTPDVKAAAPPPPPSSSTSSSYVPANSPDTRPTTGGSPEDIQNAANKKQEQINAQQKAADFAHQDQMNYIQNGGSGTPQSSVAAPTQQAPSQPSPQPQQPASSPVTGSSQSASGDGGNFPIGKTYTGDATMYNDQGAGACGETYDTHSEDFFALAPGKFILPNLPDSLFPDHNLTLRQPCSTCSRAGRRARQRTICPTPIKTCSAAVKPPSRSTTKRSRPSSLIVAADARVNLTST